MSALSMPALRTEAQDLQVGFGGKGVASITYRGLTLESTTAVPSDAFHIWHMKATDLNGNVISSGQYGWGESNNGESWSPDTHTETYTFSWGSIATQFVQNGNELDMIVTETNNAGSGIVFDGAEIYPFALHFPQDPAGFSGYTQNVLTTRDPGVSAADFGIGVVTAVLPDETQPMYTGWKSAGAATYTPIMTSTLPDGSPNFLASSDRPVQPGSSFTYTVALRFTPEGTVANASDAYDSFAATYPSQMTWTDKRILGTSYLASSPSGSDITQPGGFPTNPRRWFNDASVDITTAAGLQAFQNRILAQAASNAANARLLNAQGVITWDIEGEEYPQTTSYVCSPDQIATVAPEMESVITDSTSPWNGQRLDDAYFKIMSNAGLRTGVCLRPQVFSLGANGTAQQNYLSANAQIVANLENKARYANGRWGTTLFYVDSTVDSTGDPLDPAIFQQLSTDLPAFLFIPEESTTRYYAYTAPFYSFLFHGTMGTASAVYQAYPNAFGANLINDVAASTLAAAIPQLTAAVTHGDILMGHVDYWQANDPVLVNIYAAAGIGDPTQTTPVLTWPSPASITYGTTLSSAQLNATASVAGTFTYSPAAGTVPNAGTSSLSVSFTPNNTSSYTSAHATVPLTVTQATPTLSWSVPPSIASGTALSSAQLNASANIPGTFAYTPGVGTILAPGTTQLTAVFTPSDAADYSTAAVTVPLTVSAAATPAIIWGDPAAIVYGTAISSAQLNATASVSGSFSYSPAPGTILSAGTQQLTATFTPADTNTYASVTISRTVQVLKATPQISWTSPAAITAGTALSSVQLNAIANVAGSFSYSPGTDTIPSAGTATLQAVFTPADTADFNFATASVSLQVNAAVIANPTSNVQILSPSVGDVLSGSVVIQGYVNLPLDSAGSYLMVDGTEIGTQRATSGPFLYGLDTKALSNGVHTLQLWAHDIGNNTTLSAPVQITVQN